VRYVSFATPNRFIPALSGWNTDIHNIVSSKSVIQRFQSFVWHANSAGAGSTADAAGLPGGPSRSPLQEETLLFRCHGLAPWSFTFPAHATPLAHTFCDFLCFLWPSSPWLRPCRAGFHPCSIRGLLFFLLSPPYFVFAAPLFTPSSAAPRQFPGSKAA
jgi:hypothetical protein